MKTVSISDFVRLCRRHAPIVYKFDSGDQLAPENDSPARVVSKYSDIAYMLNPNRLCLKNESGSVCFNCVEEIQCEESSPSVGNVITIVCSSYAGVGSVSYTIFTDKKIFPCTD